MKNALVVLCLLFFVNSIGFAQESGNRIYGNQGYSQQAKRNPTFGSGNLMNGNGNFQIEATVLMNLKPDSFVAVFGVAQEAKDADESNNKLNARIEDFLRSLSGLGIVKTDTYVDFITQNKVYDFEIKGDVAEQILAGFETKKTVAVKYKSRDLFEKILSAATKAQIYDLIKVDYIVSDLEAVKERLFDEALKVVKKKEAKYQNAFGMTLKSFGLISEKYDAFYPAERYENYQASESGAVENTSYREGKTFVYLRKSTTFFYEPLNGDAFDRMINPISIEPTVQFTVYLQVQYGVL
jgi:uncharacterized protein YggE